MVKLGYSISDEASQLLNFTPPHSRLQLQAALLPRTPFPFAPRISATLPKVGWVNSEIIMPSAPQAQHFPLVSRLLQQPLAQIAEMERRNMPPMAGGGAALRQSQDSWSIYQACGCEFRFLPAASDSSRVGRLEDHISDHGLLFFFLLLVTGHHSLLLAVILALCAAVVQSVCVHKQVAVVI